MKPQQYYSETEIIQKALFRVFKLKKKVAGENCKEGRALSRHDNGGLVGQDAGEEHPTSA